MADPVQPQIKGLSTIRWGVDQVAAITDLMNNSVSASREPSINKTVKDEKGNIVSRIIGDGHFKATIKAVYLGATPPAIGDWLTLALDGSDSQDAFVVNVTWEYGNESELMLTIQVEAHEQISNSGGGGGG